LTKMNLFREQFKNALTASRWLNLITTGKINDILNDVAEAAIEKTDYILAENQKDLDIMDPADPKYDRLKLTKDRIAAIAADILNVAALPSPLGQVLSKTVRPNGLKISRVRVPFGVIGIIYEARPNVTFDVFSLCLKSGNACILKGGSDAINSNRAIVSVIHKVLDESGVDENILTLLPSGREATNELLNAHGYVDLLIPRGSQSLIDFVRQNATIPVIETGAGICHTYFDEKGDREKGKVIINNAKTRRVSVCNALDCLIIHHSRLSDLAYITELLVQSNVEIFADEQSYDALKDKYPAHLLKRASEDSFGTEFLSYKMSVKTVFSFEAALEHISAFSSKHSEAIITEDKQRQEMFLKMVDASSVYVNASTAFTDGAQFGLGAEIGISTQKLHARGPMALEELTSYKWLIEGDGQIRPK
jgi:glutamate-5-semialdehyde dehydrogenase